MAISKRLTRQEVQEAEQKLSDLGYWTGPVDGVFDSISKQALIAFQKIAGRKRTGILNRSELDALRSASASKPRDRSYSHIEVDLTHQILMFVDDTGKVSKILPVCSGNEKFFKEDGRRERAHTPRGIFKVTRKIDGWRRSKLGLLYYPNYIVGGVAIHGSPAMKVFPASHGCIRIPMFAAREVSDLTPVGTVVMVYD